MPVLRARVAAMAKCHNRKIIVIENAHLRGVPD